MNGNGLGPENRGTGTGRRMGACMGQGKGFRRGAGMTMLSIDVLLSRIEALEKRFEAEKLDKDL